MADRPILCTGPMVRALLADTKTQTRRLLYSERVVPDGLAIPGHAKFDLRYRPPIIDFNRHRMGTYWTLSGWQNAKPGDRLWVKECIYKQGNDTGIYYAADGLRHGDATWCWKRAGMPSIHMPKGLSRITLEVTGTKIERLQDISDADAIAEGVRTFRAGWEDKEALEMFLRGTEAAVETNYGTTAQRLFYLLWTRLHGYQGWTDNPWVVAMTFKVHHHNILGLTGLAA